jgi:microcystin-dependent protein
MATAPYNNLTLPDPTVTTGPTWSTELNAALTTLDAHDHTPGKGTLVPTAGLNINADLNFNSHAATAVTKAAFTSQASAFSAATTLAVYVVNGDLWYNNNSGTPVQLTAGSSITSASSPLVPSGVVWAYGGASAPTGFLMCDWSAVSRTTYADLFAVIGTTYGVGDGSTTFNLPPAAGRAPIGAGTYVDPTSGSVTRTLGSVLGEEKHVLSTPEMPSHSHVDSGHSHSLNDPGHAHSFTAYQTAGGGTVPAADGVASAAGFSTNAATTGITMSAAAAVIQNTGGGTSHNNMQPSFVVNYIIKT